MIELDDITIKRAQKGDNKAFKLLYNHYANFIWKVLFTMCGRDGTVARELTQDTFVKVHAALPGFRGGSALSTWMYKIAYTTALELFRKRDRWKPVPVETVNLDGGYKADAFDEEELTKKILAALSADDRFLLVSREVDDLPFETIAEITGRSSGALRTQLHRVKETVRNMFTDKIMSGVDYVE